MSIKMNGKSKTTAAVNGTVKAASNADKSGVLAKTKSMLKRADELCAAREQFETTTLARSNAELYGILSSVYALFTQAVDSNCLKETIKGMSSALTKRGFRVQSNTPALTVFVRYVFNSDRKRAYNYASTLMAALQADIEPSELAQFIESKNGVEECKKEFRKKEETIKRETEIKEAAGKVLKRLATMKAKQVVELGGADIEFADGAQYAFVIARVGKQGTLELLQTVSKTTMGMQNAAICELAKSYVAQQATDETLELKKDEFTMTAKAAAGMKVMDLEAA